MHFIAQVHVDEKNPTMFRELSQWVDDEGLDHAVDIFSEFLSFMLLLVDVNVQLMLISGGPMWKAVFLSLSRLNIVRGGPNMLHAELQGVNTEQLGAVRHFALFFK